MAKKVIPGDPEKAKPAAQGPQAPQQSQPGPDSTLYMPGEYEITNDEDFKIDVYLKRQEKRWTIVGSEKEAEKVHWALFRMWSYEEEVELRKQATNFDPIKRLHLVDNDLLNRLKLKRLLKAWSFEKDNPRMELHHVNGILVDEVFARVMKLHPNILRYIVEQMNGILEYNG